MNPHARLADLQADDYAWVCVDLFDTLVTRTVHPEDVKRLACERLAHVAVPWLSGGSLYRLRASAERETSERNAASGLDLEFSLDECLARVADRIPALREGDRPSFVQLGLDLELSIECSVQVLDGTIAEFVRAAVSVGQ